jgi:hypothetical protein
MSMLCLQLELAALPLNLSLILLKMIWILPGLILTYFTNRQFNHLKECLQLYVILYSVSTALIPRYARVNLLLTSMENVLQKLKSEGYIMNKVPQEKLEKVPYTVMLLIKLT